LQSQEKTSRSTPKSAFAESADGSGRC
jgi:hypothetical protein